MDKRLYCPKCKKQLSLGLMKTGQICCNLCKTPICNKRFRRYARAMDQLAENIIW